ncbi:MAG: LysR family transcriptional regulator [Confluentimicrobium sp.]|uniref:HTH-type transcriptional regulator MetR n=2 Tax=Celeribacter TaxID=875170 RepID=A0A2T5H0E2_9RHOB|nr:MULTISPECIES: LysR family transcriptional regulator [Roseobacteraceae]MBC58870.1 LysR family transcriptional regulator [Actibacterium sp.]PTQ65041.1 LysR family transcriptional regulator [Celeribacter persicus]|tara:strand:- start:5979 stop:6866 length:888 start_codon:yes stop_codon:yes gene_type:complete
MIDLQPLAILREIDRTGSLTQAADKLFLTQSAVSHAVRRFEERYQVKLWKREGHKLRLTPSGEYLLGLANRVLPQLEYGAVVLGDYARGRRGAIRVGMECHPCQDWLMRVLDPFLSQWPDVDLDVTTAFQFGGLAALLSHEIDILVTPDPVEQPGIEYQSVFDYELVLAVAETHPLADKGRAEPADLAGDTLITYPVSRERLDIYTQFLIPAHALPRRHRTVETTDLMLRLVASGRAVSATPDWLLRDAKGVRGVRLGQGIAKSIHLGHRKGECPNYLSGFMELAATVQIETVQI